MKIKFEYPLDTPEVYNVYEQTAYIYLAPEYDEKKLVDEIELLINHAYLHYIIHMLVDAKTSHGFDLIASKVLRWDIEVYKVLY